MRIHLLGVPNTITSDVDTCPFTAKVFKLGKMLTNEGHHVIHYGNEKSSLTYAEHVPVTTEADIEQSYPGHEILRDGPPLLKDADPVYRTFTDNTINALYDRKRPGDILLATFGGWHKSVALAHPDLICIEPGIGYPNGAFSENRVFESYAIMHAYQTNAAATVPSNDYWYDAVIPIAFDPGKFIFSERKDDFLLFMGRLHRGKGLHIAMQVAEATKQRLIVAGYGANDDIDMRDTPYVKFIGAISGQEKITYLSRAKAVICPSLFLEPFNAVQIEAMMSGTPVISSDWGAFAEYNAHGQTGYRCKSFEQFCWASEHTHDLDPNNIRLWASRFSLDEIAPHYTDYFKTVKDCYGKQGWFERRPGRETLRSASFQNDAFF